MQTTVALPDEVLEQIERLARRVKRPRRAFYGDGAVRYLRWARQAVVDALGGAVGESALAPPP